MCIKCQLTSLDLFWLILSVKLFFWFSSHFIVPIWNDSIAGQLQWFCLYTYSAFVMSHCIHILTQHILHINICIHSLSWPNLKCKQFSAHFFQLNVAFPLEKKTNVCMVWKMYVHVYIRIVYLRTFWYSVLFCLFLNNLWYKLWGLLKTKKTLYQYIEKIQYWKKCGQFLPCNKVGT